MKSLSILLISVLTGLSLSVFAQDSTKQNLKAQKQKMEKMKYSCPMHADVVSHKPGKCPKCSMDLTKSKIKPAKMYSCPMHADVTSDQPGKCPKCGMDLIKSKIKSAKMYSCPMHSDVTGDKPGKCPKCGMDLKEKHQH